AGERAGNRPGFFFPCQGRRIDRHDRLGVGDLRRRRRFRTRFDGFARHEQRIIGKLGLCLASQRCPGCQPGKRPARPGSSNRAAHDALKKEAILLSAKESPPIRRTAPPLCVRNSPFLVDYSAPMRNGEWRMRNWEWREAGTLVHAVGMMIDADISAEDVLE